MKEAKEEFQKQINPDTSEFECFFHYTDEGVFSAGFKKGFELANNSKKTRLIEWSKLNLLPIRVQNILIMIYEENYKNGNVIYLEDLKWNEFKKYRQAGKWSWFRFQEIRKY